MAKPFAKASPETPARALAGSISKLKRHFAKAPAMALAKALAREAKGAKGIQGARDTNKKNYKMSLGGQKMKPYLVVHFQSAFWHQGSVCPK